MCGILAIYCKNSELSLATIWKMYENLKKRGPDCSTLILRNEYILGFHRLKIIDLSVRSNQPFFINNIVLLCNGEIFNHKKLQEKYQLECQTGSDCECILHLYTKLGIENTVSCLDGDFAFVLLDFNKRV